MQKVRKSPLTVCLVSAVAKGLQPVEVFKSRQHEPHGSRVHENRGGRVEVSIGENMMAFQAVGCVRIGGISVPATNSLMRKFRERAEFARASGCGKGRI